MFEELRRAVDEVVVPATGDAIVELRAVLDRASARLAEAEAAYARDGGWERDGFGSMAAFERHRARLGETESRRVATRAARLAAWPEYLGAWSAGALTGAQVDATVALVPDRHVGRFATVAGENAAIVAALDVADTRTVLRAWVDRADQLAEREAAEQGVDVVDPPPERELSADRTLDDELFVRGHLDADSAVVVEKALLAATRPDGPEERRSPTQRRADALVDISHWYLRSLENPDGNRTTGRVSLVAEIPALYRATLRGAGVRTADELTAFLAARPGLGALERGLFLDAFDGKGEVARTLDGNPISDGLLSCISSNGTLERVLTVEGRILDMGRSVRTFTPAQRRAIEVRDQGCRRAGCDRGPEHSSVHHVEPWESGGRTDVSNGVLKCDHEHLDDHRKGWVDELGPDGTYTVVTDAGARLTTRPPGLSPPAPLPVPTCSEPAPSLPFEPTPTRPVSARTGPPNPDSPEGRLLDTVLRGLTEHAHDDTPVFDAHRRRRRGLTVWVGPEQVMFD